MDNSFSRKERRGEGPPQSPSRGKSGWAGNCFIHPLPLRGLPPVSGGESVTVENTPRQLTVPLRQAGRAQSAEGVDEQFSDFRSVVRISSNKFNQGLNLLTFGIKSKLFLLSLIRKFGKSLT